jgi:dTDP-glucose 4,6-dehydratase/UDP-glucuronate decarboxylase
MNTVLIAGGAGFIGSQLVKQLLTEGNRVICLDNLRTGNKKNIEPLLRNPNFTYIEHDVTQPFASAEHKIDRISSIYHLASPASPNAKSPRSYIAFPVETLLTNSVGTYNLLELAKTHQAKFLYTSTSEVYGNPSVSPQPETYFGNVNPNGVRSVYDEGKRFGEAMTFAYLRKFGVDTRIVRLFNTYGPNMQKDDGRVVSNLINQAIENQPLTVYGDGKQTRSFCYVDDMIHALMKAMNSDNTKGEVFNLGNPDERTVGEIAVIIQRMTKTTAEIVYEDLPADDPLQRKPDITKAQTILQWKPEIGLEDGLQRTIDYFKTV